MKRLQTMNAALVIVVFMIMISSALLAGVFIIILDKYKIVSHTGELQ